MENQKSLHIETLRGIAIILVVIGHVIGSDRLGGMKVDDNSIYRYLYCFFENIRMPLFTVISGLVYSFHPVTKEYSLLFISKKIRRLIFPMIFVGTLYFLIQYITPGTNSKNELSDILNIYIYPYTMFWYLPALFLVFMITTALETLNLLNSFKKWIIAVLLSWGVCFCQISHIIPEETPNIFAFKNALYLLPFFITGLGLYRFNKELNSHHLRKTYFIIALLGIIMQQIYYFYPDYFSFYSKYKLAIPIGIISSAFLVYNNFENKLLVKLSLYAYSIYLFHGFGSSGGRILLSKINVDNELIVLIFATTIAILSSIVIEKIFAKWRLTRNLFLGKK